MGNNVLPDSVHDISSLLLIFTFDSLRMLSSEDESCRDLLYTLSVLLDKLEGAVDEDQR